jgi:eukaryotic-like serine/threonine-protein kinase
MSPPNEQLHHDTFALPPRAVAGLTSMTREGLAFAGAALVAVVSYAAWILPRVRVRAGWLLNATLMAAGVAASLWFSSAFLWSVVAMLLCHAWWSLRGAATEDASSLVMAPRHANTPPPGSALGSTVERAMLGRYAIERELGRGAMGAVYLGREPPAGRAVAIKTMALGREFAGTELVEARARFFREAELAGRLQHPNIVTIFNAGEEDGLAYIAMEFVDGHDLLPHTVGARLLALGDVLQITARVADALGYAHRQGVVHRDIKPANVMVDATFKTVKVTDFGIARVTDTCRTRTGLVLGTPAFMSPEQMAGGHLDGRSDLYSLGVMLFQLVTGALPHASDSMARLMHQIAVDPAPDVRSLRPELPAALAQLIKAALEKRPELRPPDCAHMGSALRAIRNTLATDPAESPRIEAPGSGSFGAGATVCATEPRHNSEL